MIHKPLEITLVTNNGSVMTSGGSTKLAKGQFGIVDKGANPTKDGLAVTNSFTGKPKDNLFQLRLGIHDLGTLAQGRSNKSYESRPFKLSDVVKIEATAPSKLGGDVDEWWIGYNGFDADTAITMKNGQTEKFDITLSGTGVAFANYPGGKVTISLIISAPYEGPFTMEQIITEAVEKLQNTTMAGGIKVTDYIDVTPINSENPIEVVGTDFTLYTLTVPNGGDTNEQADVYSQYPGLDIKYQGSIDNKATYVTASTSAPATYKIKTTAITVDCDKYVSSNTTEVAVAWVAGETCTAVQKKFTLTLGDTKCGTNRLAEVQAAYAGLTIALEGDSKRTVTLTGTSGTANIVVGGVNYLATFATDLTTTANNFITAHASALALKGVTVTAEAGKLNFVANTSTYPTLTVANVTTNLAGTISNIAVVPSTNCQSRYSTSVLTNFVCEECSPIIRDLFEATAPDPFDFIDWVEEKPAYSENALMGIRIKGKQTIFAGGEEFRDTIPFVYDFIRVNVTGGYPITIAENIVDGVNGTFFVKNISTGSRPSGLGMDYMDKEERARVYFTGDTRFCDNLYGNRVLGYESLLKPLAQYVMYSIYVETSKYAQSNSLKHQENFKYDILVEVGKHTAVETLVNALATASGLPTVSAY